MNDTASPACLLHACWVPAQPQARTRAGHAARGAHS